MSSTDESNPTITTSVEATASSVAHSEAGSDVQPEMSDMLLNYIQQQQAMNANILANFLTSGNKNVCDALLEIKSAIDTSSRCILKLCDLIEAKHST